MKEGEEGCEEVVGRGGAEGDSSSIRFTVLPCAISRWNEIMS